MHPKPDVCIVGAGIIGLSLALELEGRGASVTVLERDTPLAHASQAAAGMLAGLDPDNPPQLLSLAELSLALYPQFLSRIEALCGQSVPFQTTLTYQSVAHASVDHAAVQPNLPKELVPGAHRFVRLDERSLDPRQLAPALLAAVRATSIRILEHTTLRTAASTGPGSAIHLETTIGPMQTRQLVYTLGPWSSPPVAPRKGQMLAVRIPRTLPLDYVVRTSEIYIVPRLRGPRAGQAVIGATVEDAGFCLQTSPASLDRLRAVAARLLPALADEASAPTVDRWAGIRPDTPDHLPLLGAVLPEDHAEEPANQFIATGHYRNGILLAPATGLILAQLLTGETPSVDLVDFSPHRFDTRLKLGEQPIFAHAT